MYRHISAFNLLLLNNIHFISEKSICRSVLVNSLTTQSESRLCRCVLACLASFLSALLWRQVSRLPISATFPLHPANWDQYIVNVLKQLIPCVHSPGLFSFLCLSRETYCLVRSHSFTSLLPCWSLGSFFVHLYLLLNLISLPYWLIQAFAFISFLFLHLLFPLLIVFLRNRN